MDKATVGIRRVVCFEGLILRLLLRLVLLVEHIVFFQLFERDGPDEELAYRLLYLFKGDESDSRAVLDFLSDFDADKELNYFE